MNKRNFIPHDGGKSDPGKEVSTEDGTKNDSIFTRLLIDIGEIKGYLTHTAKTSDVERLKGDLCSQIKDVKGDLSSQITGVEKELKRVPSTFQMWLGILTAVFAVAGLIFIVLNYSAASS